MSKRILGEFPIFGSKAKLGNLVTLSGKVYNDTGWEAPATLDTANFLEGFKRVSECETEVVTPEKLNGILNYLSHGINYLYNRGIAEHSLNVLYPLGAVVTFEGEIYISKVDSNKHHPSQSLFWDKLGNSTSEPSDSNPIGSIMTVPLTYTKDGYIDYQEGQRFNKTLYPELFKVLGTDTFGTSTDSNEQLPVGTVIHYLGSSIPEGWIEWRSQTGNLRNYPDLVQLLKQVMQGLSLEDRQVWEEALSRQTFPQLDNFFLKAGSFNNGQTSEGSLPSLGFTTLPVVLDTSNTLNPLGVARCTEDKLLSPIINAKTVESQIDTQVVLVGQKTENYFDVNPKLVNVNLGSGVGTEVSPRHLTTRLIVKARRLNTGVPSTHKQIIKAF